MAVIYEEAVKDDRMAATRDHFIGGALASLEVLDADDVLLAAFMLSDEAGTILHGVWALEFSSDSVAAAATGVAAKAQIKNVDGVARVTGLTVGITDADVVLDDLTITEAQVVVIGAATITHAA